MAKKTKENYLETVLVLEDRGRAVHSVDIAAALSVSKASVSIAMKNLRRDGCIYMGKDHEIMLTARGREIAQTAYERHLLFSRILIYLGVDRETAHSDACRLEHAISEDSSKALKRYFAQRLSEI